MHPNEVVTKQLSKDEIDLLLNDQEYKLITASHDFINVFKEIRNGKALWKIFLIMAIILFLLETWIGRPSLNSSKK